MKIYIYRSIVTGIIVILIGTVFGLGFYLFHLYQSAIPFTRDTSPSQNFRKYSHIRSFTKDDLGKIAPWMTFDYIAHAFGISPQILQSHLLITNSLYPNISLAHYAKQESIDPALVLLNVQTAVSNILAGAH